MGLDEEKISFILFILFFFKITNFLIMKGKQEIQSASWRISWFKKKSAQYDFMKFVEGQFSILLKKKLKIPVSICHL